ncbi:MAG: hypothetical protein K2Y05_04285 [Hyphomicrobiaceae bacterium]|nr:hypothetical protein [Hyphomicrobiaceae bacterium]
MRSSSTLAVIAAMIAAILVGALPASATDFKCADVPHGWAHERLVHHWVYYPRYHHVYHANSATDPYAYKTEPRGYYPYYNSGYWKARREVAKNRAHFKHPVYYKAWGANRKHYRHHKWHAEHHGRHKLGHW